LFNKNLDKNPRRKHFAISITENGIGVNVSKEISKNNTTKICWYKIN